MFNEQGCDGNERLIGYPAPIKSQDYTQNFYRDREIILSTTLVSGCVSLCPHKKDSPTIHKIDQGYGMIHLLQPRGTYDMYKLQYAEMLYGWGLLDKRCEVLKFVGGMGGDDLDSIISKKSEFSLTFVF